ncbi:MAG: hypothetical protein AAF296_02140 [Pseudomonadota bacterium]
MSYFNKLICLSAFVSMGVLMGILPVSSAEAQRRAPANPAQDTDEAPTPRPSISNRIVVAPRPLTPSQNTAQFSYDDFLTLPSRTDQGYQFMVCTFGPTNIIKIHHAFGEIDQVLSIGATRDFGSGQNSNRSKPASGACWMQDAFVGGSQLGEFNFTFGKNGKPRWTTPGRDDSALKRYSRGVAHHFRPYFTSSGMVMRAFQTAGPGRGRAGDRDIPIVSLDFTGQQTYILRLEEGFTGTAVAYMEDIASYAQSRNQRR